MRVAYLGLHSSKTLLILCSVQYEQSDSQWWLCGFSTSHMWHVMVKRAVFFYPLCINQSGSENIPAIKTGPFAE